MIDEQTVIQPEGDGPTRDRERRSEPRRRCRGRGFALFVIRPSLRCFRVPVRDASTYGISFLHDRPLEVGTILALQLGAGMPAASWVRTARVVHATPQGEEWLIGCRVSPPLSVGELESL
jgi:hypothetical protein